MSALSRQRWSVSICTAGLTTRSRGTLHQQASLAVSAPLTLNVMPHSRQHHRCRTGCITVFFALFVCACSVPGIRWEDTDIAGPPLASGNPTKQIRRCDAVTHHGWASGGTYNRCDVAFRSDDGTQIDAFGVQVDISEALPRALPLQPLLEQFRSANRGSAKSFQGYWLYLIAVNPAVVIGIPQKMGDPYCSSPGWTKCFTATELYQMEDRHARRANFTVYYNTHPPVREGAFVLVPEWKSDSMHLPAERSAVTFSEKGTSFTLVQRDSTWQISGPKP